MNRTQQTTVAAILQFVLCASNIVLALPDLAKGASPQSGGPSGYMVTVFNFAIHVIGVVAVYGIWKNMKWGKNLAIAVDAISALLLLPAVIFVPLVEKVLAGALILWNILIIVLLLWRAPKLADV